MITGPALVRLRMLVDLRWMIPGQSGGLETAAYCFVERLLARREVVTGSVAVTLIVPWELSDRFRAAAPASVAILSRDSVMSDARRVASALTGSARGRAPDADDFDVVYTMTGRLLEAYPETLAVVLVADLQHLVYPQFFEPRELAIRTAASQAVARRARHIVTISEFCRQEIMRLLGVEAARVSVSHLAVDPVFDRHPSQVERDGVLARHGLAGRRYLLLPAQVWPHKNHETVLAALGKLVHSGQDPPMLVSTGQTTSPFARDLMERIARSELASHVRFLGLCPQADLPALYSGAEALVFCSLYEGFGMPLLEAMRMGCPVIASTTTSMPEVAGDAAVLIDPDDAEAIARAIVRVQREPGLKARLIAAGHARAQSFSWDRHCDEIFAALHVGCGLAQPEPAPSDRIDLRGVEVKRTLGTRFRTTTYPRMRHRVLAALRGRNG